jgi:hypothetical protein
MGAKIALELERATTAAKPDGKGVAMNLILRHALVAGGLK